MYIYNNNKTGTLSQTSLEITDKLGDPKLILSEKKKKKTLNVFTSRIFFSLYAVAQVLFVDDTQYNLQYCLLQQKCKS